VISFFDPMYLCGRYVPVIHAYYDRADMLRSTQHVVDHSHSLCEIMYVCEGTMSIELAEGVVHVGRRQFVWLDSNVRHWDLRFSEDLCSMMNIEFQYEALDTRAPSLGELSQSDKSMAYLLGHPCSHMLLTDRNETIYRLMKEIIVLADSTHTQAEKLCSLLCTQVVLEVARLSCLHLNVNTPVKNRYVSEAIALMQHDYPESLTAAVIAEQLHIQPTYLHRLFREHTGLTMGEHLQNIRIQHAQELLLHTDDTLLDVSSAVGIGSQQHFTRLFKRIVGLSPLEYRRGRDAKAPQIKPVDSHQ
jgi:AraC family transcriptional regulator, melibiose operon regulatory protein